MKSIYLASGILLAGLVGSIYRSGGAETRPGPIQASESQAKTKPASGSEWQSELCILASQPADSQGNCEFASQYRSASAIIAFVPDPYLTRLRLQFDRSIEAITWAAQDAGFTSFRAQWIPWRATEPAELSRLEDRNQDDDDQKQRRKLPGLLVFSGADKSLIVWLVGESPTHGFNREQFAKAFARVREAQASSSASDVSARPVRIVGPCFSGTLPLLSNVLAGEWTKDARLTVAVLSGTANNTESEDGFASQVSSHPGSRFNSFSYQDSLRIRALEAYLHGPLGAERSMSVLSEDGTAFGFRGSKESARPNAGIQDFAEAFRFPRGVAYLRNAYQADPGLLSFSVQESATPRRSLQLSLKAPEIGHDSVPEFSDQTPVSAESQVRQIAETLLHDRTPMAAVIATDVLDTLFMGKFLRVSAPNTRLTFMDADFLRNRPDDYPSLEGSLQVSSFPQVSARHEWLKNLGAPFSSEFEEGFYTAASAALWEAAVSDGTFQNYKKVGVRANEPPLWLTVLGNGEEWPLAILNDPAGSGPNDFHDKFLLNPPSTGVPSLSYEPPSRFWRNVFRLGLLLTLAYFGVLLYAQWPHGKHKEYDRLWSDVWLKPEEPAAFARAFYLLCLTLSLAACWLTVNSGIIGYQRDGQTLSAGQQLQIFGPALALLFLSLWMTYQAFTRPDRIFRFDVARRWHYRLLTVAAWTLFVGFLVSLYNLLTPGRYFKSFFYSYRAIEIGSGVSPVLPLLFVFLGFACWSAVQLQRRVFSEERYQLLPDLSANQIVGGIKNLVVDIEEYIEATFPLPFFRSLAISGILSVFAFRITRFQFGSLEGPSYDNFYSASVAALATLLFLCTWRFWRCWKLLQLFLEQLALHPIRDAFDALPAEHSFSWSPIWQASPRKRSYELYSRSVECLRQIRIESGRPMSTIEEPLSSVQELMGFVARGTREEFKVQNGLQVALQDAAQDFVDRLNQAEWTKGSSKTWKKQEEARKAAFRWPEEDDETGQEKFAVLAKEFVVLRFVAFIRYVMLQLRNLLTFIMLGFVLLALSLGSYPFGSPQLLAWTLIGCLAATGVPVIWAFLEMERDTILSLMSDTKVGEVGKRSFLLRVTSFGILPLLSVLASHFPSIGQYVFSWVQPVIKSVH